ncbi:MAG: SiaB family protein kinase [Bacteroidales bacterium]|nr:SiaB family protein kinase [Bacteroidales bacterium]
MSFSVENYFEGLQSGNVIFSYKGDISSGLINQILDSVEKMSGQSDDSSRTRKRVYNVLVESLQNLYHHVDSVPDDLKEESAGKFGLIVVSRDADGYTITSGNFVLNRKVGALEKKIEKINNSSSEEIKELYKHILHHQKISEKGGGGLGLVDIARKTGNKLLYKFMGYNDTHSFFTLTACIDFSKDE